LPHSAHFRIQSKATVDDETTPKLSWTHRFRIHGDLTASCGMLDDQFYSISSGIRLKYSRRCR
jgi:hypothetical protein